MTKYSRFLTLDCSFAGTGWAWGDQKKLEKSGVYKMSKQLRRSQNLNGFKRWLKELVDVNRIEKIYFEQPIMPYARATVNARGKAEVQQNTSLDAMTALLGCVIVVGLVGDDCGIDVYPLAMQTWRSELGTPTMCPPSVKKHLKGADAGRKWVKAQTIIKVRSLGYSPSGDDEADAIGMFECIKHRRESKIAEPSLGLFDDMIAP